MSESADAETRGRRSLLEFWLLLRGHRRAVAFATALSLTGTIIALVQPALVKQLIEAAGTGHAPGWLVPVLLLVFVLQALVGAVGHYVLSRTGEGVLLGLRKRLVDHLLRLTARVHDRNRIGDLISRTNTDTTVVREAVAHSFSEIVTSTIGVAGAVIAMTWLDPLLFLIVLAVVSVAAVTASTVFVRIRVAMQRCQASVGDMTAELERALSAMRTVRACRAESRESARISARAEDAYHAGVRMAKLDSVVAPAIELAVNGSILIVLLVGGLRAAHGTTSLGDLVAFLLYVTYLVIPLSSLFGAVGTIQRGLGALARVDVALAMPTERMGIRCVKEPEERQSDAAAVEFQNVWFRYGDHPVLKGVSFSIPRRAHVAIVGRSGAGKSTIFELIERFYEPDLGEIRLGGRQACGMSRADVRTMVNLVEQQAPVLHGTLRDNIAYAVPDATDEELRWVINAACLGELVARLPEGLDTEVGDHGSLLSGGERQRVAIARALLVRPAVLLMDEPTSQLDAFNEMALTKVMREISTQRALVVIAHRMSTVRAADQIIVLDDGTVAAVGRHEELIQANALYRKLASGGLDRQPSEIPG